MMLGGTAVTVAVSVSTAALSTATKTSAFLNDWTNWILGVFVPMTLGGLVGALLQVLTCINPVAFGEATLAKKAKGPEASVATSILLATVLDIPPIVLPRLKNCTLKNGDVGNT